MRNILQQTHEKLLQGHCKPEEWGHFYNQINLIPYFRDLNQRYGWRCMSLLPRHLESILLRANQQLLDTEGETYVVLEGALKVGEIVVAEGEGYSGYTKPAALVDSYLFKLPSVSTPAFKTVDKSQQAAASKKAHRLLMVSQEPQATKWKAIRKIAFLQSLSQYDQLQLILSTQMNSHRRGDPIVTIGQHPHRVGVVLQGKLQNVFTLTSQTVGTKDVPVQNYVVEGEWILLQEYFAVQTAKFQSKVYSVEAKILWFDSVRLFQTVSIIPYLSVWSCFKQIAQYGLQKRMKNQKARLQHQKSLKFKKIGAQDIPERLRNKFLTHEITSRPKKPSISTIPRPEEGWYYLNGLIHKGNLTEHRNVRAVVPEGGRKQLWFPQQFTEDSMSSKDKITLRREALLKVRLTEPKTRYNMSHSLDSRQPTLSSQHAINALYRKGSKKSLDLEDQYELPSLNQSYNTIDSLQLNLSTLMNSIEEIMSKKKQRYLMSNRETLIKRRSKTPLIIM